MIPLLVILLGCGTCPDGFERRDGSCLPAGAGAGEPQPLTAETFPDRYEREACWQLEDCAEDELCEDNDCEADFDCDGLDWSWTEGCAFDEDAAEDCIDGEWTCDVDGYWLTVGPPLACDMVFDCT